MDGLGGVHDERHLQGALLAVCKEINDGMINIQDIIQNLPLKLKYCGENLLLKTNHAVRLLGYIMFRIIYYNFD